MRVSILALACALAPAAGARAADAPRSQDAVPVFKGATRDEAAERELRSQEGDTGTRGAPRARSTVRVYRSTSAPEEVFAFYRKALGARAESGQPEEGAPPAPGRTTPVVFSVQLHDPADFEDRREHGILVTLGPAAKAAFEKGGRRPIQDGRFLREGQFSWAAGSAAGRETGFLLNVLDDSVREVEDPGTGQVRRQIRIGTRIELRVDEGLSESAERALAEEEREADLDRVHAAKARELRTRPPTEKDLGVPVYPGARFDPELSAGLTMDNDDRVWVFFSDDPPAKVLAFYEQRTGKKSTAADKGKHLIALRGASLLPEHGVSIEALEGNPLFKGKGRTVVSVVRRRTER
jgi:hypothetical protein